MRKDSVAKIRHRPCLARRVGLLIFAVWVSVHFPTPLTPQTLAGVIDIHAHCDPDSVRRSIDAIDLVRLARARGMRGLVLKNHNEPTASWAYLMRKETPGIEVFGGIVLNRAVGGVNAAAVEHMTAVKGSWGRMVWMPTFDAENQVRYSKRIDPSCLSLATESSYPR